MTTASEVDDLGESATRRARGRRVGRFVPWFIVVVLAVALGVVASRSGSAPVDASVTIAPSRETAAKWELHPITNYGDDRRQPAHRIGYLGQQLRILSLSDKVDPNRREVWTTGRSYRDVDVTVLVEPPSSLGPEVFPQPGIALRTDIEPDGSGSAIIIDQNIWKEAFTNLKVNVWRWPASTDRLQADGQGDLEMRLRSATITAVERLAGDPATDLIHLAPPTDGGTSPRFTTGDHVSIEPLADQSYAQTQAVVDQVQNDTLVVTHASNAPASPLALEGGTVHHAVVDHSLSPDALYPRYIRARVVGNQLDVKSWLVEDPEPPWQLSMDLSLLHGVPESGQVGLVANHLTGTGEYVAYGDVTIDPIRSH